MSNRKLNRETSAAPDAVAHWLSDNRAQIAVQQTVYARTGILQNQPVFGDREGYATTNIDEAYILPNADDFNYFYPDLRRASEVTIALVAPSIKPPQSDACTSVISDMVVMVRPVDAARNPVAGAEPLVIAAHAIKDGNRKDVLTGSLWRAKPHSGEIGNPAQIREHTVMEACLPHWTGVPDHQLVPMRRIVTITPPRVERTAVKSEAFYGFWRDGKFLCAAVFPKGAVQKEDPRKDPATDQKNIEKRCLYWGNNVEDAVRSSRGPRKLAACVRRMAEKANDPVDEFLQARHLCKIHVTALPVSAVLDASGIVLPPERVQVMTAGRDITFFGRTPRSGENTGRCLSKAIGYKNSDTPTADFLTRGAMIDRRIIIEPVGERPQRRTRIRHRSRPDPRVA